MNETERLKKLIDIAKRVESAPKMPIPTQVFKSTKVPVLKQLVLDDSKIYY
jgi:hypothetical protein